MLRDYLKCPVCGEAEIICELSGCDQTADVPLEPETDLLFFVLHVGDLGDTAARVQQQLEFTSKIRRSTLQ